MGNRHHGGQAPPPRAVTRPTAPPKPPVAAVAKPVRPRRWPWPRGARNRLQRLLHIGPYEVVPAPWPSTFEERDKGTTRVGCMRGPGGPAGPRGLPDHPGGSRWPAGCPAVTPGRAREAPPASARGPLVPQGRDHFSLAYTFSCAYSRVVQVPNVGMTQMTGYIGVSLGGSR